MKSEILESIASDLVVSGEGILAADESFSTIEKRFASIGVESTEESRRSYRQLLFETPGLEEFVSGVILFDETIRQTTDEGVPYPELLGKKGIITGIKVDRGAKAMAGFPGEKITEGLDSLRERLAEYRTLGACFTKWRAVIRIGDGIPTGSCIEANAHALARFAALSQEAGLVPVVEPEVLYDGDHTMKKCEEVTAAVWKTLFSELYNQRIYLEGMLLKASMVLPGKECPELASVERVAETTLKLLRHYVPVAVPGVVFLSGGQSPVMATKHLNAMNLPARQLWTLSFSFSRALQEPVLKAWKGDAANREAAQKALYHRAKCSSAACMGVYTESMEESGREKAKKPQKSMAAK